MSENLEQNTDTTNLEHNEFKSSNSPAAILFVLYISFMFMIIMPIELLQEYGGPQGIRIVESFDTTFLKIAGGLLGCGGGLLWISFRKKSIVFMVLGTMFLFGSGWFWLIGFGVV